MSLFLNGGTVLKGRLQLNFNEIVNSSFIKEIEDEE